MPHIIRIFILLLLLCAAEKRVSAQQQHCSNDSNSFPTQATIPKLSSSYGGLDGFYSIATGIADGLHGELTGDLLHRFADTVLGKNNDSGKLVSDVLKNQAGFLVFIAIGALFIIIFPITGCFYFCCRCCCNKCGAKRKQKKGASTTKLVVLLVTVVICFAFLLTGTIIYGMSVSNGENSIDSLNKDANKLATDFDYFLSSTSDQLINGAKCSIDKTLDDVKVNVSSAPNKTIGVFTQLTGLDSLNNMIDSATIIVDQVPSLLNANSLAQVATNNYISHFESYYGQVIQRYPHAPSDDSAKSELENIKAVLDRLPKLITDANTTFNSLLGSSITQTANLTNKKVNDVRNELLGSASLGDISHQISAASMAVDKVIDQFRNLTNTAQKYFDKVTDAINDAHNSIESFGGKNAIFALVKVIVLLPCCVVLVLIGTGAACGGAGYRSELPPNRRISLSHTAGYIAIGTCFLLFAIGGHLMFLSTTVFTAGYALQFGCQPLFYDDSYQVFDFVDQFIPNITSPMDNSSVSISIRNVIQGCQQSKTIYTVVDGDKIFNVGQILGEVKFNGSFIEGHINGSLDFNLTMDEQNKIAGWKRDLQNISHLSITTPPTEITVQFLNSLLDFFNKKGGDPPLANGANDLITQAGQLDSSINKVVNQINSTIMLVLSDIDYLTTNRTPSSDATTHANEFAICYFQQLNSTTYSSLYSFQDSLRNNIANCLPVYDTWQNVGELVCKKLGHPLQGMWASLGLTVLYFVPTIIALTLVSKYLYRMENEY